MKFEDYSPPVIPSLDQREALRRGLGRAWQWALNGRLSEGPLLEACLRDQRFDTQIEDSRGDWLWQLIQAAGATQRLRVPILHALHDLSDEESANQLCELARGYAQSRDQPFRDRLYEIVEQKLFPKKTWLGEMEIVALDGEQAFLFSSRLRGGQLETRQWNWQDRSLVRQAVATFGEDRVATLLEASSDAALRRFFDGWRGDNEATGSQEQAEARRKELRATPVKEVFDKAGAGTKRNWFRRWGRHADERDLRTVAHYLWVAADPRVVADLLQVFSDRALPEFDGRLIGLCRHSDQEVRRRAVHALEQNSHPLIREFAFTELRNGAADVSVAGLFIKNYRLGDEREILEAMQVPADDCQRHWLLMDITKVLEANAEADCSRLGVISYALTPCQFCRCDTAQLLLERNAAPVWLKEECRLDVGKHCRELAQRCGGRENDH